MAIEFKHKIHFITAFLIALLSQPVAGARKRQPDRSSGHDHHAMPKDLQRFQKSRTYSELVDLLMKQVMDKFEEKSSQDRKPSERDLQTANEAQNSEDGLQTRTYRQESSQARPSIIDKPEPVTRWRIKNGGNTKRKAKNEKLLLEPRRTTEERSEGANRTDKRDMTYPPSKRNFNNDVPTTANVDESVERIELLLEDPFENQAEFNPKNRMFKIP